MLPVTTKQCCENKGVPGNCIGYCVRKKSNSRSLEEKSKIKKFVSVCSKYEEIAENCLLMTHGTIDEGE